MLRRCVCVIFAVFEVTCAYVTSNPVVNTKLGKIRGVQADDGDYSMYLGIPYADIDEKKPFGDSTPHPPFQSVYDAFDDSSKCPQQDEYTKQLVGDFDCLRLNVYVPNNIKPKELLPVLIWIHGGGFVQGNSGRFQFGPRFLMNHDIIFVSLNYRLGVYGFLCLDTPEVPGNQALKDQVVGLRWIKNNIEAFGGDPNRITVMGESAGTVFAEVHMLSKFEKLFDAAILQSGSIYGPEYIKTVESNKMVAMEICKKLGFETNNTNEIVRFLTSMNPMKIVEAFFDLNYRLPVCIEHSFENITSIVSERPHISSISHDKIVPILGGYNNREELVMYTDHPGRFLTKNLIHENLELLFHDNQRMVDIVHRFYLGDEKISHAVKDHLINFKSDFNHNYPTQRSLLEYMRLGAPVYQYLFSYNGTRNLVKTRFNITELGASHADELSYIFDISYDKHATEVDQLMIDRMTTLWTNFVKYRNPTPEVTELIPVKWTPINEIKLPYLNIDVNMTMESRPFHSRLAFWDLFFYAFEKEKL